MPEKTPGFIKVFTLIGLGWFVIRPAFNPAFLGLQNGFQMIGLLMINMYFNKKQERIKSKMIRFLFFSIF